MTEKQLSFNKGSEQETANSYLDGLIGSIATRVLLICILLLVLPLTVHTFMLYKEDYQNGLKSIVFNLNTLAKAQQGLLNEFINNTTADIRAVDLLVNFPHGPLSSYSVPELKKEYGSLSGKFAEIAIDQNYSSFFYQTLDDKENLFCIIAADPERIGKQNLLKHKYDRVKDFKVFPFLGIDPLNNEKQLYISIITKDIPDMVMPGVLTAGISTQALITKLQKAEGIQYPLKIALLSNEGSIFEVSSPDVIDKPMATFSLEDMAAIINNAYPEFDQSIKNLNDEGTLFVRMPIAGNSFYFMIGLPKSLLVGYSKQETSRHIFRLSLLFVLLGGSAVVLMVLRLTKPLKDLAGSMQKVANGDLTARFTSDKMGFEINLLGEDFNRMVESLTFHMKEAKDQRLAKELLEQELGIGREIQKTILPREMPRIKGLELASGFMPAQEVAGDFFDIYLRKDNKLVVAIADASGKGISACLYSLCMRSMLRSFETSIDNLKLILEKTNEVFCLDTEESGVFVTLWVGMLDIHTKELEYCSCGHPPTLLRHKDGSIEELSTPGMALGVVKDLAVQVGKKKIEEGEILLLYTDGTIEAHNKEGELYGLNRLKKNLQDYAGSSMSFFVNHLVKSVEFFSHDIKMFDDLTLLSIKLVPEKDH